MPSVVRIHLCPPNERLKTENEQIEIAEIEIAGVAQLVELQPSKLVVEGSSPFARSNGYRKTGSESTGDARSNGYRKDWFQIDWRRPPEKLDRVDRRRPLRGGKNTSLKNPPS